MPQDRSQPVDDQPNIHATADVAANAVIGAGTQVWHQAQVRGGARIGMQCIVGKGAYIDVDVVIGDRCKLQNSVFVYHGSHLEDGVFLGPGVMLLNDHAPRAITPEGALKGDADWSISGVTVGRGASVGGGSVLLPGVRVGSFALVGAGSVVTSSVPDHGLVYGNPARLVGFVCRCAGRLKPVAENTETYRMECPACGREELIAIADYRRARATVQSQEIAR
jgi:UDP-2-acetamido-3-amino-2,3-dideoxy-glucuronate N-acetyltransferase